MTPAAIVRQQAEARAKRDILDKLKRPTLEMINAGYDALGNALISATAVHRIFVAMIEEFEDGVG